MSLLVALWSRFRVVVLELVGAGLVVAGGALVAPALGFVLAGVAVLVKSLEVDLRRGGDR